ncbi:MAG: hypothetical protein A3D31_04175 [Candidatus Fluviicola riflensis]|nr:MAG: hypothetical protein CHH17_10855 [Candidatus Fluviicola riflensis]OGS79173.1 MAG: hypothetical protein A3D31_04175 [Candidatus Fluviicola riflensis]OGS86605.1 MAG: hypothetical protein A2724_03635 [Fluviicola sp. RIFCSPHIGHO2_01_FULL_43_53]OGS88921.1 MAG: hypothetical protein A3E30_01025 [Fluviicola sp. RIFCSPHIGHO2_12_FULL_43_24]
MKITQKIALFGITGLLTVHTTAQTTGNVYQVVQSSQNHTTLYETIKTTEFAETLGGKGPYTVFAPTNDAFALLPPGELERMRTAERKQDLTDMLNYHIVEGKYDETALRDAIKKGNGEAKLKTVSGGKLTFRVVGDSIVLTDGKGGDSVISKTDADASNGVVYIVDNVLMKK